MLKDIQFALRGLAKHPGFTAIAVIILALSIAATTAIFSVVNSVRRCRAARFSRRMRNPARIELWL